MRRALQLIALALAAAIAATIVTLASRQHTDDASVPARGPYRGSSPPPGIHLTRFTLRNQRDQIVSTRGLDGKVVVFTFLRLGLQGQLPDHRRSDRTSN
jgi:cytochrome oxidase Cu insertion factor (SCO1/SenC/PrrC family)